MLPPPAFFADTCATFGLGTPISSPLNVSGGLSNRLYRLQTDRGTFAIKRMVANADATDFKSNVEASFRVELLAHAAGVAMPPPVRAVGTDDALARITDGEGPCWVRVHEWVNAQPVLPTDLEGGDSAAIAGMLVTLHQIPAPAVHEPLQPVPSRDWPAALPRKVASPDLLRAIAAMEEWVSAGYAAAGPERVMSHRDLDQKNVLRTANGELVLVDWDAAGPVIAEWDVVTTALDWANVRGARVSEAAFDYFMSAYVAAGGHLDPLTHNSFAGWCEGVLDWLWFNLERATTDDPTERQLGNAEVALSAHFIPPAAHWIAAYT